MTMANDKKSSYPQQTNSQDPQQPAQPAPQQALPTPPVVDADGKTVEPVKPGDEPRAMENKSSHGQGTTQDDADKAAAGNYRVLEPIAYGGADGHSKAVAGDIVFLSAEDAKGLLKAKAVESADTTGADEKTKTTDPRKIQ
jgi:hypothetical protein